MNPRLKSCVLLIMALCLQFSAAAWTDENDLVWSTFLGGNSFDKGRGVAVDLAGNAYVTGYTESNDFPTTAGAYDTTYDGYGDVFVVKLNQMGNTLVYATFLEGNADDDGHGIAVGSAGNAYVTGETKSTDFPTTAEAFDTSYNGSWRDVFVINLNPTGDTLVYGTFLGGSDIEIGYGITLGIWANAYITGITQSADFPTTAGAYDTVYSSLVYPSVFVAKLNPTGQLLDYATFVEGSQDDYARGIALDSVGSAYVTGETWSGDFPTTVGAFDTVYDGNGDVFVLKLNSAGSALNYATFLGGSWDEYGYGIALDSVGSAYVTGETWSGDFPTTVGALDTSYENVDAFVVKLSPEGDSLRYATFIGGGYDDYGRAIAVDDSGSAHVVGETWSDDFPVTVGAYDTTFNGDYDAFVVKLSPMGNALDYGTFLGGIYDDFGRGIALDSSGDVRATGWTSSYNFPTTSGAFDEGHNGSDDAFVTKLKLRGLVNPPEAVDNLQITLAGESLLLTWSAVTADTSGRPLTTDLYYVYRDTLTYFLPGSLPFDSTVSIHYMDGTGAVGDAGVNYYYTVTAISQGKESKFSEVVGEFDWSLLNARH